MFATMNSHPPIKHRGAGGNAVIKTDGINKSIFKQGEKVSCIKLSRVKRLPSPCHSEILYVVADHTDYMLILTVPCPFASK